MTALEPVEVAGIVTAASPAAVLEMQQAYRELCRQLLDDSDYTQIGRKRFTNKSGWRKLAVAFNLSDELREKEIHRDAGFRVVAAEFTVRAIAPNGRFQDGYGACDIHDRCCPRAVGETCSNRQSRHEHCVAGCSGRIHFSTPDHDIPSTAMTRATSRAYSDLFGQGEQTAEDLRRDVDGDTGEIRDQGQQSRAARRPAEQGGGELRMAQDAQIEMIFSLASQLALDLPAAYALIGMAPGDPLPFAKARELTDALRLKIAERGQPREDQTT